MEFRRLILLMGIVVFFLTVKEGEGRVLSAKTVRVAELHVFLRQLPPTAPKYVMTDFTPGNIKFLQRMDIVLDGDGEVEGVVLVYTPGDGFRRSVFLKGVKGWSFKSPNLGSLYKDIMIRVITADELNNP